MPLTRPTVRALVVGATLALTATAVTLPATAAPTATTGVVTGTVTGGGKPLAGVVVQVGVVEGITPAYFNVVASTTTRRDGSYRLDGVPADTYRVQYLAAGATGGTSATGYGDHCHGGEGLCTDFGTDVTVTAGRTTKVDDALTPAGILKGRLTDKLGRGVGGLSVQVFTGGNDQSGDSFEAPYRHTTSDVNGNWVVPQLSTHNYTLCYGNTQTAILAGTPNVDGYVAQCPTDAFAVLSGKTTTAKARLVGGGGVRGTVVSSATGYPVAGAEVSLSDSESLFRPLPTTTTDANGRFRLAGLRPGRHLITVDAHPYFVQDVHVTVTSFETTPAGRILVVPAD